MDKIADLLAHVSQQLTALTAQYGPATVDTMGRVYQLTAISKLAIFPGALLSALVGVAVVFYGINHRPAPRDESPCLVVGAVLAFLSGVIGLAAFFLAFLDARLWASAFDPHMALAIHLVQAVSP